MLIFNEKSCCSAVLLFALLSAHGILAQTCRLTGELAGPGKEPLKYVNGEGALRHEDSIQVVAGHFAQVIKPSMTGLAWIRKGHVWVPFWTEPGTVRVRGDFGNPLRWAVTGTPENEVLNTYTQNVLWKYDGNFTKNTVPDSVQRKARKQATYQFIQAYPAARTSAYLLYQDVYALAHMLEIRAVPEYAVADYLQLANKLTPAVRASWHGQRAIAELTRLSSRPVVGQPVPAFTALDTLGRPVALVAYRGQYVLLNFWEHGEPACLRDLPKIAAVHKQCAKRLVLINVAVEVDEESASWKETIRDHAMPGLQLADKQELVSTKYDVTNFPTYMLLDRGGTLLLRTRKMNDITQKLASLPDL